MNLQQSLLQELLARQVKIRDRQGHWHRVSTLNLKQLEYLCITTSEQWIKIPDPTHSTREKAAQPPQTIPGNRHPIYSATPSP
ncbi:MAG: hypothetical protein KC594_11555 [Nitrospira sp.]|nr:hypothetical protein [Nitrospira sp.]